MKIALIARSTLFTAKGGDTVQLINMAASLGRHGIKADIKLTHEPIAYPAYDLLHFYNIGRPADILCHIAKSRVPFVISPNLVDYGEYDKQHRRGSVGVLLSLVSVNAGEYIKNIARWLLRKDRLMSKSYLWRGHYGSIRYILKRASLVLPSSEAEYERMTAMYKITPPCHIVPNGVDQLLFGAPSPVEKEKELVLCAARIEGIKNQVNLIKALNNTRYKVIIAGAPSPNQPGYYRHCRKIAADNIFFADHLPQEELLSYYQRAKVHILPSWFETCGLSTLEAGMAGCNVVITGKGYAHEYFRDHAFYCDPASPASIRKAVDRAAGQTVSGKLRKRIEELYTWPLTAATAANAYRKVLAAKQSLRIGILGTRGIPNHYGGFEQFAEHVSAWLSAKGHDVTVYNSHNHPYRSATLGNVHIAHCYDPEYLLGSFGQFIYDLNCIRDTRKKNFDIILMLGYTSSSVWGALFPRKTTVLFNMDGLEWQRAKYSPAIRRFLYFAERLAMKYGDFHIADSQVVQQHLQKKYALPCEYIGYGAAILNNEDEKLLAEYQVSPYGYFMLMARIEPENNVEAILEGFAASSSTKKFLVVGNTGNKLGRRLLAKFGHDNRICFTGPIFNNAQKLHTLKRFSYLYFHGHSVGGTNPSLLEAMASRALIAAHNNPFNRAILGENAFYFSSVTDITAIIENIPRNGRENRMISGNLEKIRQKFTWQQVTRQYESYFFKCLQRKEMARLAPEHNLGVPNAPKIVQSVIPR